MPVTQETGKRIIFARKFGANRENRKIPLLKCYVCGVNIYFQIYVYYIFYIFVYMCKDHKDVEKQNGNEKRSSMLSCLDFFMQRYKH